MRDRGVRDDADGDDVGAVSDDVSGRVCDADGSCCDDGKWVCVWLRLGWFD